MAYRNLLLFTATIITFAACLMLFGVRERVSRAAASDACACGNQGCCDRDGPLRLNPERARRFAAVFRS
jgi:hypothetical protein